MRDLFRDPEGQLQWILLLGMLVMGFLRFLLLLGPFLAGIFIGWKLM